MPADRALRWRMALWLGLIASVIAWIALPDTPLFTLGAISVFGNDLVVMGGLVLGTIELLRLAGASEKGILRFVSRLLIAYLLYQLLVVLPVAMWLGKAPLTMVIRTMSVRFYWILFPALLPLFRDTRMRRLAGLALLAAAVGLSVWGVYLALTGGGHFYTDGGEGIRYRIFGALAPPLFAWPLALAASGVFGTFGSIALGGLTVLDQTLTGFRSGILAYGLAGLTGLLTSRRLSRVATWVLPAALLVAVVLLMWSSTTNAIYGYTLNHLFDLGSTNAVDRMTRWGLASDFIRAHPFNDYVWSWQRYLLQLNLGYEPHDFILEIGTTEGIAGFAFYGVLIVTVASAAWKRIWDDAETRAVTCFLLAYVVFSGLNANWYSYSSMPLMIAAVTAVVARLDQLAREAAGAQHDPPPLD